MKEIKEKLKLLINKDFKSKKNIYIELEEVLKGLSKGKIKNLKNQIKYNIDQRSLIYKTQIIWQFGIYIFSFFFWIIIISFLTKKQGIKNYST